MNITEWFDIEDPDHIAAWIHLCKKGSWPEKFITENISFKRDWVLSISLRMALKYCENYKEKGEV